MTQLRVGCAVEDITPYWPLTLAGFAVRTHPAGGVARSLRVRVAVLESETALGEIARLAIISGDLLWWGPQQLPDLWRDVSKLAGIPEDSILFSATHTHSGPQTTTRASNTIGVVDDRFLDLLRERTLAGVGRAVRDLEPVRMTRVSGTHALGFNRRLHLNPDGLEDPILTVIRFSRDDDQVKALFVHYTCHPTITQEHLISGEFCGVAMDALAEATGGTALYLQGCCGDINPMVGEELRIVRGTDADVERLGTALAGRVLALLAEPGEMLDAIPLQSRQLTVDLPFAQDAEGTIPEGSTLAEGVEAEWHRALRDHPEWRGPSIPLQMQRLDLANRCSLLAMNGEIVVEYGLHVRARSGGTMLPMGYANGMTGYVPTARQIGEGGYEAGGAVPYFFLPAPFDPAVEGILRDALDRLIAAP